MNNNNGIISDQYNLPGGFNSANIGSTIGTPPDNFFSKSYPKEKL